MIYFLLHASIAGLFLALYLSTLGEQLLGLIYHYDYYMRLRIQIFCMPTIAMQLLLFTKNLLPEHGNRFALRANFRYLAALVPFVTEPDETASIVIRTLGEQGRRRALEFFIAITPTI